MTPEQKGMGMQQQHPGNVRACLHNKKHMDEDCNEVDRHQAAFITCCWQEEQCMRQSAAWLDCSKHQTPLTWCSTQASLARQDLCLTKLAPFLECLILLNHHAADAGHAMLEKSTWQDHNIGLHKLSCNVIHITNTSKQLQPDEHARLGLLPFCQSLQLLSKAAILSSDQCCSATEACYRPVKIGQDLSDAGCSNCLGSSSMHQG